MELLQEILDFMWWMCSIIGDDGEGI